jgi:hypothetical protein
MEPGIVNVEKIDTVLCLVRCKCWVTGFERSGIITNEHGNPLPYASVKIAGTQIGTIADSSGAYSMEIPEKYLGTLEFSSVGYHTSIINVRGTQRLLTTDVVLQPVDTIYSSVVVVAPRTCICRRYINCRVGGTRCNKAYKVRDTLPVLQEQDAITVFPNPAAKQSYINIKPGVEGVYQLRLMDNNGMMIHMQQFSVNEKAGHYQYKLPLTASAGIHYLVMDNRTTQKQYTEKIIIY